MKFTAQKNCGINPCFINYKYPTILPEYSSIFFLGCINCMTPNGVYDRMVVNQCHVKIFVLFVAVQMALSYYCY